MSKYMSVENLTKTFGDEKKVLQSLSLEIPKNKITFIMGPNGAGKTTLIKTLLGLLEWDAGEIFLNGIPLNLPLPPSVKKKIGYISDEPLLLEYLTAFENIEYINAIYKKEKTCEQLEEILTKYGLVASNNTLVKSYSRGMRTKLNLSFIDVIEPEFIIMDEPTIGLDIVSIEYLKAQILKYKNKGKTLLITSHDLAFVSDLADLIYILNEGKTRMLNLNLSESTVSSKQISEAILSKLSEK